MANVRELKKDINFLTTEILSQCFMKVSLMDTVKQEDIQPVMVQALAMQHELISRVNHSNGKHNKVIIKAYFKDIRKTLLEKTTELFDKIEAV